MHSIWWHCTSILLEVLNLGIVWIRLADEVLSSFLPLKIGVEPLAIGVRERNIQWTLNTHFIGPTST